MSTNPQDATSSHPSPSNNSKPAGSSKPKGKRPPPTRATQVSKKLSWLLRHGAEKENLPLQTGGYALVSDVLANRNLKSFKVTFAEVREVVKDDAKGRYSLIPTESNPDGASGETKDWLIRANQGHSLKIDEEGLLEPLTLEKESEWPEVVVHGTTRKAWPLILGSGGVSRMGRNHVHFAAGLPDGFKSVKEGDGVEGEEKAAPVISGMRNSSTVLLFLDLKKALERGLVFGRSANGVVLSEGDKDGLIPLECFLRVEDRIGGEILVENGKIVKELSAKPAN